MNAPVKTVRQLESFIAGDWVRGAGKAVPLLDAATGAEVALIDASGLDMKRALNHGREEGGPALRKLSFHERALPPGRTAFFRPRRRRNLLLAPNPMLRARETRPCRRGFLPRSLWEPVGEWKNRRNDQRHQTESPAIA